MCTPYGAMTIFEVENTAIMMVAWGQRQPDNANAPVLASMTQEVPEFFHLVDNDILGRPASRQLRNQDSVECCSAATRVYIFGCRSGEAAAWPEQCYGALGATTSHGLATVSSCDRCMKSKGSPKSVLDDGAGRRRRMPLLSETSGNRSMARECGSSLGEGLDNFPP